MIDKKCYYFWLGMWCCIGNYQRTWHDVGRILWIFKIEMNVEITDKGKDDF